MLAAAGGGRAEPETCVRTGLSDLRGREILVLAVTQACLGQSDEAVPPPPSKVTPKCFRPGAFAAAAGLIGQNFMKF